MVVSPNWIPAACQLRGGRLFRYCIKGCFFIPPVLSPCICHRHFLCCVFSYIQRAALRCPLFIFRVTLSRAFFIKNFVHNATHMCTTFSDERICFTTGKFSLCGYRTSLSKDRICIFFIISASQITKNRKSVWVHIWHLYRFSVFLKIFCSGRMS